MPITLCHLYLLTVFLASVTLQYEIPRRSYVIRRAIDGRRGSKYFDPHEDGAFDSFGSAGGQYDPYEQETDLRDIRRNVPGEPGMDYPAYTTLPQTGFTCEGRQRGYYADEVAGCQVFHVCHDVLVSSFLCPIGSIFSQKLLTCDWWAKVDCSSSMKYTDINRDTYQQDDDEMIRNAYAMISLHSGKDVTQDGLVDPDRTIIDYHRDLGRIIDFPMLDPTANDLRHMFDDYRMAGVRQFLTAYNQFQRKQEAGRKYPGRIYPKEKTVPLKDSRIIRIQKIEDPHRVLVNQRENYRRPNEFLEKFQPSYAPTVPTVTTTTRRLYSPTVPTTYRPSTLAYSKLDQLIDSSDRYYSETGSYVTPPTKVLQSATSQTEAPLVIPGKRNESSFNYDEYYDDANLEVEFGTAGNADSDGIDEIDTRESIGLGQALRQSSRGISIGRQNPTDPHPKNSNDANRFLAASNSSAVHDKGVNNYNHVLSKPKLVIPIEEEKKKTENADEGTTVKEDFDSFVPLTTLPSLETTIEATTKPFNKETKELDRKVSSGRSESESTVSFPPDFLVPPIETPTKFRINVPDIPRQVAAVILDRSEKVVKNSKEDITTTTEKRGEDISSDKEELESPSTEIVPPFEEYNDGKESETSYSQTERSTTFEFTNDPTEEETRTEVSVQASVSLREDVPYQVSLPVINEQSSTDRTKNSSSTEEVVEDASDADAEATTDVKLPLKRLDSNTNTLSLRQLMQELLKLNRYPRPFTQTDPEAKEETSAAHIQSSRQTENTEESDPEEILRGSSSQSGQTSLKQQILEKLRESFGHPLYNEKEEVPIFELPAIRRTIDFETGLPIGSTEEIEESKTTLAEEEPLFDEVRETTTFSSVGTSQTEKSITKTEFLPSLSFSLNTNEGREEYVEAILGGLLSEDRDSTKEANRTVSEEEVVPRGQDPL